MRALLTVLAVMAIATPAMADGNRFPERVKAGQPVAAAKAEDTKFAPSQVEPAAGIEAPVKGKVTATVSASTGKDADGYADSEGTVNPSRQIGSMYNK